MGSADAGYGFGLDVGDSITTTGVFNDSTLVDVGAESVVFSATSGNSLNIMAPSILQTNQ